MLSHLSSPPLVRLLRDWVQVGDEPARQDVAERLGEWLGAFDSVQLEGALQALASYAASARRVQGSGRDAAALDAALQRAQTELTHLISARASPAVPLHGAPQSAVDLPQEPGDARYTPFLQRYQTLQQQVATKVAACRALVRQSLAKGSPAMRQLSALDGVMEQMLGAREQKLWSTVPVYLERRFEHWRQAAADMAPGAWLAAFERDLRTVFQAEVQARLLPVLGLIEAVQNENREQA